MLDADDQSLVQLEPLNRLANVPLMKLCISEAEMVEALAEVGAKPNVLWNAASIALLAAEVVDEK